MFMSCLIGKSNTPIMFIHRCVYQTKLQEHGVMVKGPGYTRYKNENWKLKLFFFLKLKPHYDHHVGFEHET